MPRSFVILQLCVLLRESALAAGAAGDECSSGYHCEVDAALFLQHSGNHGNESSNAPVNSTLGPMGTKHEPREVGDVRGVKMQSQEAPIDQALMDNITMEKLADQMAKQMTWEFQSSKGTLQKVAGPGTMTQVTENNPKSLSGQEVSLFVRADYKAVAPAMGEAKVQVELQMAAPGQILWVYAILWMPLALAWLWSGLPVPSQELRPRQSLQFRQLLQLSVGALTISAVVSNQSLCILTRAPMALTLFQSAVAACMGATLWAFQVWLNPAQHPTARQIRAGLWRWMPCATCFACFQVSDHFVSNYTSITERIVLGNLVPVLSWIAEMTFPNTFQSKDQASISAKVALFSTVCGAVFFVAEDSALTALGVSSCALCSVILLIYRLTQRGVLVNLLACPVSILLTFDSVVSCLISYSLCGPADLTAMRDWSTWIETPQVFVLLLLSGIGMGIGHLVVILCLRTSSATLTMVICNVASMICLVQGMVLFNDSQFQHPLALVGMTINLIGGVWYTTSQVGIIEIDSDTKAVVYKDIHREGSPK